MNMMTLRTMFLLLLLHFVLAGGSMALEGYQDRNPDEVQRIEAAFIAGLGSAGTPGETYDCLRFRNAKLVRVMETTYAAILAWLAGRQGMRNALERDQAAWLSELATVDNLWGNSIDEAIAAQSAISTMLLERLVFFSSFTADAVFDETVVH